MTRIARRHQGFSLIELLVVIVILASLMAIAIPTLLAQREKAWDTSARSDAQLVLRAVKAEITPHNTLPADLVTQIASAEPSLGVMSGSAFAANQVQIQLIGDDAAVLRTASKSGRHVLCQVETARSTSTCAEQEDAASGTYTASSYTNLVTMPSAETGLTTGWTVDGAGAIATTGTVAWRGTHSYQATSNGALGYVGIQRSGQAIAANQPYTLQTRMRSAVPGMVGRVYLQWRDASNAVITAPASAEVPLSTTDWTRVAVKADSPANATTVHIYLRMGRPGFTPALTSGDRVFIDGISLMLTGNVNAPYFDGASAPGWWTGAPHMSTSQGYQWGS